MNEAFYEFFNMVGDPAWVCFACLITGLFSGFAIFLVAGAADDLRNYLALMREVCFVRKAVQEKEAP